MDCDTGIVSACAVVPVVNVEENVWASRRAAPSVKSNFFIGVLFGPAPDEDRGLVTPRGEKREDKERRREGEEESGGLSGWAIQELNHPRRDNRLLNSPENQVFCG